MRELLGLEENEGGDDDDTSCISAVSTSPPLLASWKSQSSTARVVGVPPLLFEGVPSLILLEGDLAVYTIEFILCARDISLMSILACCSIKSYLFS